jgi:predicted membrane-bound spermidine synthase
MLVILALLFILSGAAGLFYESVWSRYLGLFVGHNAYAQVIVLVIFLGGMALGAMIVGRMTQRIRDPLFGYALIEAVIGLIGLLFQDIYVGVTNWAYASVFPATAGSALLVISKWSLAALLILPQSILLGATFPLMSAGVLRRLRQEPGRTLSVLYFANSFGAAVGVLIAGFYLVEISGLPGTILAAAIINFLVAIGAILAMKYWPPAEAAEPAQAPVPSAAEPPSRRAAESTIQRLLLWTALGTAVASFIYEIAWIRMLSLVLSSATHSFELMLSAFILGLALGSFWVRRRADRFRDPLRTLGLVQVCMGLLALATLPLYFQAFGWMGTFLQTFARSEPGYVGFNLARYAICLLVMLPATFCAGITLPLITRTLVLGGVGERAIGQVYSWNTFGSILGVSLAALVLMPAVGLKTVLATGALLDMAVGLVILFVVARSAPAARRLALGAAAVVAVVALVAALSPAFDRHLLISGVYRFGTVPAKGSREILYYRDGRTATVSAEKILSNGEIFIATNGKSDGALSSYWLEPCDDSKPRHPLRGDAATLALAALITLAHKPNAESGAVIGQGTGMSSHLLLGSPALKALYTIEIEPKMIEASRAFLPANRRVFDDPRSHFVVDDAKSYFAGAGRQYDYIFSEPSHPWVSGVSGLFTAEFYDRVRQYLKPGGVFAQWIHIYDINDRLVMTVLSALHQKFTNYEVFMPAASDMLVIATDGVDVPKPDWSIFQYPDIARDFCHQIPFTPEAMEATRLGNRASLGPLVERFPQYNSDFYPHLDNGAERTRYMAQQATGIFGLSFERFDVTAPFIGRRIGPAGFTLAPVPDIPRMYNLSLGATLRDPRSYAPSDTIPDDDRKSTALYRERAWQAELASTEAPGDWRVWIQRMADIERDRYGGTTGYADEAFYAEIYRFLARHRAPPNVRSVVEFRQGVLGWDFPRALRAAEPLVAAALDRKSWMPPDELREGLIVARLATGDAEGARRAFEALAPLSRRPSGDFRTALLSAYIQEAQEQRRAGR